MKLNEEQRDITTGMLLGDGWIEKVRPKNRSVNTHLAAEHCLQQEEYVAGLAKTLDPFCLDLKYRTRKNPFKTLESHKQEISSCILRTRSLPVFTELRTTWYKDDKKTIPTNLKLTWRAIAIWYCDDGCNLLGQRCKRRHGVLCTNSFSITDVKILSELLKEKGVESKMYLNYQKPLLHITKDSFMYFLTNIKNYIPWTCFAYKLLTN